MTNDQEEKRPQHVIQATRRAMLYAAAGAATLGPLAALGITQGFAAEGSEGDFPKHPNWKFVFVNHVTTNPFFVPTQYGISDGCALLGCSYQWTGSQTSIASEMVNAMNAAIAAKADGIAVCLVDPHAFNEPVERALQAGIPVFSYNADTKDNKRLAYIGQDLYLSGKALGERIVGLVNQGDVVGFIATPGQLNIQPRLDGAADAIKASGKKINFQQVATGPTVNEEVSRVDAFYVGHPNLKGMFAVDAGSTMAVAKTMEKYGLHDKGVRAGGFDLLPNTLAGINNGHLDFTIDQQPYLQGLYTVMQMFVFQMSGGLTGPADVNTGLNFITKSNVEPYLKTQSRFQGNASAEKALSRSGPINS
jgi:simple sugar transport system substrate-binding protein